MEKQKSIKLNFIMESLLAMSSFIFPLITFPYVSRIILPEGTGKVSFALSLVSYFNIFAQLGIPKYGIRACAKVRDNKEALSRTVQELLIINTVMTVISYIAFGIMLAAVPRLQEEKVLYIIMSSTILFNTIGMEWLYKAMEQYTYITVRSVSFKLIALIFMFLLVHQKSDYMIYGAISIFAASASSVLNFFHAHKYITLKPLGNYDFRRHMRPVIVFFAMACATTVYTHLDTVMLGFMTNDAEVGLYNAAVKIKTIMVSIVTALGTVLLPRASYYVQHGMMDEYKRITRKSLNFVILLSVPLTIYFILFAKPVIFFLSGSAFEGSVPAMKLIMPTLFLISLSNVTGIQILVPTGRESTVLLSEVVGAIVDLILNAILIPVLGAAGAAIGTTIAELAVFAVQYYVLRNEVKDAFLSIHYFRTIIAVLISSLASFWVAFTGLNTILTILVSGILFFAVYAGILLMAKEPLAIEIIGQVLHRFIKAKK